MDGSKKTAFPEDEKKETNEKQNKMWKSDQIRHYIQPEQKQIFQNRLKCKSARKESKDIPLPSLSHINNPHSHRHSHSNNSTPYPPRGSTRNINPLVLQLHSRNKLLQRALIDIAVPAVLIKALGARIRDIGVGPVQRAAQHSAADAVRPLRVQRSIALRGALVAVCDERVALGDVVRRVESGDVGVVDVGGVGQVDDEGRDVFAT
jgi:hypothetical protein